MPTTINASTSAGLIQSADTSGILQLQTANLTALTINASQNTTVNNSLTVNSNLTVTGSTTLNSSVIRSGTAVASTSGTSIDFTSIPSWVKRITVMLNGVSLSGTSNILIQLGTSSGVTSTGYNNYALTFGGTSGSGNGFTTGFNFRGSAAASIYSGSVSITNLNSNIWTAFGGIGHAASNDGSMTMGGVSLAATLDRIRITTSNGTDTFDAGSINILFE